MLKKKKLTAAIVRAALVVGTLDLAAALLLQYLRGGKVLSVLQFIASGVFGNTAFTGGWLYGIYGIVFHYGIAMLWATVFFLAAVRMDMARHNRVFTGILFGLFVWLVMNVMVLPLSNVPSIPIIWEQAVIGAVVLIIAVGLPLAFLASRYYTVKRDR